MEYITYMQTNTFGQVVLSVLAVIGIACVLAVTVGYSIEKSAEIECETWAKYAKQYPLFYITPTQKAQCDHYEVEINAEVR